MQDSMFQRHNHLNENTWRDQWRNMKIIKIIHVDVCMVPPIYAKREKDFSFNFWSFMLDFELRGKVREKGKVLYVAEET